MPLFVKPKATLSLETVHEMLSLHFDHTWFDPSLDVGAGLSTRRIGGTA